MINFFTKLLTPIFITLGLINTPVEVPKQEQPQQIYQQEITQLKQKIQKLESEKDKEITEKKEEIPKTASQKKTLKKVKENIKKSTYTTPIIKKEITQQIVEKEATEKTQPTQEPVCGDSKNRRLYETPTEELCEIGKPSTVTENEETFTWECNNGELSVECSSLRKVDAECAYNNDEIIPVGYKREELCSRGKIKKSSGTSDHISWVCSGINGGKEKKCSSSKQVHAKCGNYNSCSMGSVTYSREEGGLKLWGCGGINGGFDTTCSAPLRIPKNGVCGSTAGTCSQGNMTNKVVSGRTTTWKCTGLNGGNITSCSKTAPDPNYYNKLEGCTVHTQIILHSIVITYSGTNTRGQDCSQFHYDPV